MYQAEAIDIIENYVEEFDSYEFEDPRGIPELYRQIRSAQREAGCILMDLVMANPDEDPKKLVEDRVCRWDRYADRQAQHKQDDSAYVVFGSLRDAGKEILWRLLTESERRISDEIGFF